MVNTLKGKVEGHELADGAHAVHGHADGQAREACLGDGRVDHAVPAVSALKGYFLNNPFDTL